MLLFKNALGVFTAILVIIIVFWGVRSAWNLFKDRPVKKYYGEETLVQRGFVPLGQWGRRETKHREESRSDIILTEGTRLIKDTDFFQKGNIILSGEARLAFQNSVVEVTPGREPRANIFVRDKAELIFENSTLKSHADDPANLFVNLNGEAKFIFSGSEGLNMLIAGGKSRIQMHNSTWAYSAPDVRSGGVRIKESAAADIKDSTIGGLTVELPAGAQAEIKNFKPGIFADMNFRRDFKIKGAAFNVFLQNSEILGDYLVNNGERGLTIFAPSDSAGLRIINSELNKFMIEIRKGNFSFDGLKLETQQDFKYNKVSIDDSKVIAQWGFLLSDARGEFTDSEGLGLFISADTELSLKNSQINELSAEDFTGALDFEESIWENTGKIGASDFTMQGSFFAQGFEKNTFYPLAWERSAVKREFPIDIFLLNPGPTPARGVLIEIFDKDNKLITRVLTDKNGHASFSIAFNDLNYRDKFRIKATKFDKKAEHDINFLTPTSIKLILQ